MDKQLIDFISEHDGKYGIVNNLINKNNIKLLEYVLTNFNQKHKDKLYEIIIESCYFCEIETFEAILTKLPDIVHYKFNSNDTISYSGYFLQRMLVGTPVDFFRKLRNS